MITVICHLEENEMRSKFMLLFHGMNDVDRDFLSYFIGGVNNIIDQNDTYRQGVCYQVSGATLIFETTFGDEFNTALVSLKSELMSFLESCKKMFSKKLIIQDHFLFASSFNFYGVQVQGGDAEINNQSIESILLNEPAVALTLPQGTLEATGKRPAPVTAQQLESPKKKPKKNHNQAKKNRDEAKRRKFIKKKFEELNELLGPSGNKNRSKKEILILTIKKLGGLSAMQQSPERGGEEMRCAPQRHHVGQSKVSLFCQRPGGRSCLTADKSSLFLARNQ